MPALVFRPFLSVAPGAARAAAPAAGAQARTAANAPLDPREAARFRELMLPHMDACYGFARFLARDPAVAEDLVQDAYLAAYRAFRGYRGGEPKAWLFAIVRSAFVSQARRDRAWRDPATVEDAEALADPSDGPEIQLVRAADDAGVRAAIEALPDPFREAIVLRELQEMSYREISEITAAPIGTVMSRLARARRMLASALAVEARP
jgi:RNA polymerase sigma-70 factor (ECF subfamily)